jgi:hypothetical protein
LPRGGGALPGVGGCAVNRERRSVEPQTTEVPEMSALAQPGRALRLPKAHLRRRFVRFRGFWISATPRRPASGTPAPAENR